MVNIGMAENRDYGLKWGEIILKKDFVKCISFQYISGETMYDWKNDRL